MVPRRVRSEGVAFCHRFTLEHTRIAQCEAIAQLGHRRRRALQVVVDNALVVCCLDGGSRTLLLANNSHPQPLRHEAHFGIVANAHRRYCRIRWTSMKVGRRIGQLRKWWRRWRRWLIGTRRSYRHVLFALRRRSLRICKKAWLAKYFHHPCEYGTAAMSARVSYHLSERTLRRAKGDAAHRAHRGSTRTPQWGEAAVPSLSSARRCGSWACSRLSRRDTIRTNALCRTRNDAKDPRLQARPFLEFEWKSSHTRFPPSCGGHPRSLGRHPSTTVTCVM